MILLKSISPRSRRAELVQLDALALPQSVPMDPLLTAAGALGLRELHIHDSLGGHENVLLPLHSSGGSMMDPSRAIIQEPGLEKPRAERAWKDLEAVLHDHRWTQEQDELIYEAHFAHKPVAAPLIAAYSTLLLTTIGARESQVLQFRLAIYEMCANIVEHGRLRVPPGEIGILLALKPGEVRGWIQDSCERFDLSAQPVGSIKEHAETRASRGYGIHMMHQLLESIGHEFNDTGNRIHFRKRIAP